MPDFSLIEDERFKAAPELDYKELADAAEKGPILGIMAKAPGVGYVRWVPSGRLFWMPELGSVPIPGDEFTRREARLAERLRRVLGSSPYGPVTRDPAEARDLLVRAMSVAPRFKAGPLPGCTCLAVSEHRAKVAENYADLHLAYDGASEEDWQAKRFHCPKTGALWLLTYGPPLHHAGDTAFLRRLT